MRRSPLPIRWRDSKQTDAGGDEPRKAGSPLPADGGKHPPLLAQQGPALGLVVLVNTRADATQTFQPPPLSPPFPVTRPPPSPLQQVCRHTPASGGRLRGAAASRRRRDGGGGTRRPPTVRLGLAAPARRPGRGGAGGGRLTAGHAGAWRPPPSLRPPSLPAFCSVLGSATPPPPFSSTSVRRWRPRPYAPRPTGASATPASPTPATPRARARARCRATLPPPSSLRDVCKGGGWRGFVADGC